MYVQCTFYIWNGIDKFFSINYSTTKTNLKGSHTSEFEFTNLLFHVRMDFDQVVAKNENPTKFSVLRRRLLSCYLKENTQKV